MDMLSPRLRRDARQACYLRLLDALSCSDQRAVKDASRLVELRRRQRIYAPGNRSDQVFIMKSGVVQLNIVNAEGRELILHFLHPGDIFGEFSVVDPEPRDHIAEAYEDTQAYAIESDVIQRLMQESPQIGYEMAKLLGLRMKAYRARVEELLF